MATRSREDEGRSIAGYRVDRELGSGGMGVVQLARQPLLDRPCVLKTLRRGLADDAENVERFGREAKAAAAVQHANVVAVYDAFSWRGALYIAQEYVDGTDLGTVLEELGGLAPQAVGRLALQVARGIEEIHARGIVHRDLKPSNLLISRTGEVKVTDFGVALDVTSSSLTRTGHCVGTPLYMSPEQLRGERVDARSDLWSLGVVLYEALTGRLPFREEPDDAPSLLRRMEKGRFERVRSAAPGVPRWLAHLVERCLRPRPDARPRSAGELRAVLERRLGTPDTSALRRELAAWLWDRGAFKSLETTTRPAATPPASAAARVRWAFAAAVGACALGLWLATTSHIYVAKLVALAGGG